MKFIKVKQQIEMFDDGMKVVVVDAIINLELVELIRENNDDSITIYLSGRDKPIKIKDKESIDLIFKGIKLTREKRTVPKV